MAILPPIPYDKPQTSFEWIDWYTKLIDTVNTADIEHNDLTGIQGGAAGDYYHLTATQAAAVTTNLSETIGDAVAALLVAGANISLTYNDVGNTLTIAVTGAELTANKDAVSGYAGLNASSRTTKGVDTTDDIIVDLATKGLVLKDTQGTPHYWRVTIDNTGVLVTADLGTTKP
jgi:hypothetical protein